MDDVVLLAAARTPIGRFLGALSTVPAPRLGAAAIAAALERSGVRPDQIQSVIMGQVLTAGAGMAPARQAAIDAGIPESASALTVNKVCASGLAAVVLAAQEIALGDVGYAVAGGMENMSLAPHFLRNSRTGIRLGTGELVDSAVHDGLWCAWQDHHMGNAAELTARKHGVSRADQDAFALESQRRAVAAQREGRFRAEIAPVTVTLKKGEQTVAEDETPRPEATPEALARLTPAFEAGGTVTPGNAPGLCDGAAALVLANRTAAERAGLRPIARITGAVSANLDPKWVFDAPVLAVKRLMEKTGRRVEEFDLIELNEAFAAQVLANGRQLGWDWSRVNVNGGAIALGHPIGASGARILVTLLYTLQARDLRRGLAVLCHGGGGAVAVSVERE
ncbi:MAG: acetyl-CoA C-acyltransferase [Chloroflexi bacterium]|nr:acetyl-CoA C-acyltransferase [Chloroflexota bacterium]